MRRLRLFLLRACLLWTCWAGAWMWGPVAAEALPPGLLTLRTAQASVSVDGQATTQSPVALPYHWDRLHSTHSGTASFVLAFDVAGAAPAAAPWGAYFLRLGNTYEVWLNGALLQRRGGLQGGTEADYAKMPRYVSLPAALLQAHNVLTIHIHAQPGRRGGLAPVVLGPEARVREVFLTESVQVDLGTRLLLFWGLVTAVLGGLLWWTQLEPGPDGVLQRDRLYGFMAVAEAVFLLRTGNKLVEQPWLPWPWWNALVVASLAGWLVYIALALCVAAGWDRWMVQRRSRLLAWGVVASGGVAGYAAIAWHMPWALTLWYGLMALLYLPFGLAFAAKAWQRPHQPLRLALAAVLLLNVAVGLRDWRVFRIDDGYGYTSLLVYTNRLFGVVLAGMAIQRFRHSRAQVRDLIDHMAQRISDKEAALQHSHQQMEQLVRAQARTEERTRILRDMHDGVGAHLSTAIRQLQSGKASQAEVLYTLRDSLDHLKLSMDALHLPPGDITGLLANLRYRLAPRFAVLDIALEWDVDALPPLPRLDSAALRQLQFMLFEAFSNVLQHAQARVLHIQAKPLPAGGFRLCIRDNGRGFDTTQPLRNGLRTLHERARALGVALTVRSAPGCTEVVIEVVA